MWSIKSHLLLSFSQAMGLEVTTTSSEGERQMKKTILTKVVPLSVAAVSTLGFAAAAQAMSFKVSGQVDRAFEYANNGKQSDFASVDNNGSNSRFRFTGSQVMDNGMTVGFIYEIGLDQLPSTSWDIGQNSNGKVHLDTRKMDTYWEGSFGKFSFGKGDGAAYYANTMDLSGTDYIGGGVWYELYSSGITFVDGSGNKLVTIGDAMSPFNYNGRENRLRYDTPSIGGLVLSTSFANGNAYELAARYKATLPGNTKFEAGAAWTDTESEGIARDPGNGGPLPVCGNTGDQPCGPSNFRRQQAYGASASLLLNSGLNFTVSYGHAKTLDMANAGTVNQQGFDAKNYFGQVGYIVGRNHFAVNYGQTNDLYADGFKGKQIGAAYVFDWTNAVQLFASYHNYSLDTPGWYKTANNVGSAKDINQIYIGTRIKFL